MFKLNKIYDLLKRKTVSTQFVPQIDGLRFLAIWLVVADHMQGFVRSKLPFDIITEGTTRYWVLYQFIDSNGRKGVLLFFALSGFILGMPFAKHFLEGQKKVNLKQYFLRRLTRIEPPYVINILACFFILMLYKGHEFASSFDKSFWGLLPNLGSSLVYAHNVIFPYNFSLNPVSWSLEIEVQFYLLAPLLIFVFKLSKIFRTSLLIFLILFFTFLQNFFNPEILTIYTFIQYFLIGFLVLDIYLSGYKLNLKPLLSFILGLCILFPFFYLQTYRTAHFDNYFIFILFSFFALVVTSDFWGKIFSWKFFTAIGGMCYSIYLWHNLIISGAGNISVHYNISRAYLPTLLWQFAMLTPAILIISGTFYLLTEKPFMDRDWPLKFKAFLRKFI